MKRGRWIACLLPLLAVCRPEAAGAEYAAFAAAVVCGVAVPGGMTGETEERSGAIDSVTVTARRPLSDIGIQKTVFDETLLHEDVTFSLADMLAHSTPVFIKSYGRGTMATVSLRGTGASHTRVTWNGMRMNSPLFGMMDLSYIPSYFIDGAALYNGASSVGVAGGGLGGAIALDTRPSDSDGFGMKYIQGVASYSTFDEYLRLSYGGGRMRSETSVLLTTSENDFTYRNYAKKDFVLDGNGNVTGWSYPLERNRNCSYRDFHILQELYYDAGRGGDFGLSAWYMDSSRGLPLLNTDYTESNTSFSRQTEKTFRGVLRWDKYAGRGRVSGQGGLPLQRHALSGAVAAQLRRCGCAGGADAVGLEELHSYPVRRCGVGDGARRTVLSGSRPLAAPALRLYRE